MCLFWLLSPQALEEQLALNTKVAVEQLKATQKQVQELEAKLKAEVTARKKAETQLTKKDR